MSAARGLFSYRPYWAERFGIAPFLPTTRAEVAKPAISVEVVDRTRDRAWVQETDAPPCHECGTLMVRNGACHKCPNCGSTSGCS